MRLIKDFFKGLGLLLLAFTPCYPILLAGLTKSYIPIYIAGGILFFIFCAAMGGECNSFHSAGNGRTTLKLLNYDFTEPTPPKRKRRRKSKRKTKQINNVVSMQQYIDSKQLEESCG